MKKILLLITIVAAGCTITSLKSMDNTSDTAYDAIIKKLKKENAELKEELARPLWLRAATIPFTITYNATGNTVNALGKILWNIGPTSNGRLALYIAVIAIITSSLHTQGIEYQDMPTVLLNLGLDASNSTTYHMIKATYAIAPNTSQHAFPQLMALIAGSTSHLLATLLSQTLFATHTGLCSLTNIEDLLAKQIGQCLTTNEDLTNNIKNCLNQTATNTLLGGDFASGLRKCIETTQNSPNTPVLDECSFTTTGNNVVLNCTIK